MKKGFTLVELLAVIIILATISLITIPIVSNIIKKSRLDTIKESADGYIRTINQDIVALNNISNGYYDVSDLELKYTGNIPSQGMITIENGHVEKAKLCIEDFSIDYNKENISQSKNDYCTESKLTIFSSLTSTKNEVTINNNEYIVNLTENPDIVSVSCDNGVDFSLQQNQLKIYGIYGNVNCKLLNNLTDSLEGIENIDVDIALLKDVTLSSYFDFPAESNVDFYMDDVTLNVNNKYFRTYGNLNIYGTKNSIIINTGQALNNSGTGTVTVNSGNYERTSGTGTTIYNEGTGTMILNDGIYKNTASGSVIQNRYKNVTEKGRIIINGGRYESNITNIYNGCGDMVINGGDFISNTGQAISNQMNSTIKISNASIISKNTENAVALCNLGTLTIDKGVYVEGPYALGCFSTNNATATINGGKFIGTVRDAIRLNSDYESNIIINDGYFEAEEFSLWAATTKGATINGGTFISKTKSAIVNFSSGTINIVQSKTPIYIKSEALIWNPAVNNYANGTINIKANTANNCNSDYRDTESGLCVYAYGTGNYDSNTSNTAVANTSQQAGIININGGNYFAGFLAISNHYDGIINIKNAIINGENSGVTNNKTGTINICNSKISSSKTDLVSRETAKINYSSDVIFTNGNNTPIVLKTTNDNIVAGYTGTCTPTN